MQSTTMLAIKRLAGVKLAVKLRISTGQERMQVRDPPWLWKPGQMLQEDQNRVIVFRII